MYSPLKKHGAEASLSFLPFWLYVTEFSFFLKKKLNLVCNRNVDCQARQRKGKRNVNFSMSVHWFGCLTVTDGMEHLKQKFLPCLSLRLEPIG